MPIESVNLSEFLIESPSKIVLMVVDGLGGLPNPKTGKSELETANIPNLRALAKESALGRTVPVTTGIAPGSGAGHLALFGYDPVDYYLKRGAMEVIGTGLKLQSGEIAARGNLCTINANGIVTDRRAGRPKTGQIAPAIEKLSKNLKLPGASVSLYAMEEHRFAAIFRGDGLSDEVSDIDPGLNDRAPLIAKAATPAAEKMARVANEFTQQARNLLADEPMWNFALLRGLSQVPNVPSMKDKFKLNSAAVASYPMYRGLAQIVGMSLLPGEIHSFREEIDAVVRDWDKFNFFFIHYKPADSAGEDYDFDRKVRMLEEFDKHLPLVRELHPDVLIIAGDHSTPAIAGMHTWHPVPFLVNSALCGIGGVAEFSERSCANGMLGTFPAKHVMNLALANAVKIDKFGA